MGKLLNIGLGLEVGLVVSANVGYLSGFEVVFTDEMNVETKVGIGKDEGLLMDCKLVGVIVVSEVGAIEGEPAESGEGLLVELGSEVESTLGGTILTVEGERVGKGDGRVLDGNIVGREKGEPVERGVVGTLEEVAVDMIVGSAVGCIP